jgi:uncharacterized protein
MLQSTFQHIPGIGERTERVLWKSGCTSWDLFLKNDYPLPKETKRRIKAGVLESRSRLADLDHVYFRQRLPPKITWRAYNSFKEHACYLDIETTGLSPQYSHVTTVCLHSRKETKNYIAGRNIGELGDDLEKYKFIVTFNGARFDLPFLMTKMGLRFPHIHLDLCFPLRSLMYTGGLKKIEKELGISRGTDGVTGLDAVHLWHAYRSGRPVTVAGERVAGDEALDMLVRYNEDDTVNLLTLAEMTVDLMEKKHKRELSQA